MLEALNPNEIALALAAADEVADRHQRVGRVAELAVDRARYEADRAERAFHAVEPETAWWPALWRPGGKPNSPPSPRQTRPWKRPSTRCRRYRGDRSWRNAADLPGLWHAPTTSDKDRKRLLRTLIAEVTLLPVTRTRPGADPIRWRTGASDELRVPRSVHRGTAVRRPSPAVDMVTRLGPTTDTHELARLLNAAGMTTGHGRPFDVKAVQWVRHAYHVPAPNP